MQDTGGRGENEVRCALARYPGVGGCPHCHTRDNRGNGIAQQSLNRRGMTHFKFLMGG